MAKQKIEWGWALFLVVPLVELIGCLRYGSAFESPYFFLALFIGGGSFLLFLWVCSSHDYKFTESSLIFRAGPFRKTVALIDIFEVGPTHDGIPESRGAVQIRYYMSGIAGDSFMMIPKNRDEFLAEIGARCPHLEAYQDGFKRAASTKATT
jgi:hypothetical protein